MMKTVMAVAELVTPNSTFTLLSSTTLNLWKEGSSSALCPTWEHAAMQGFLTRELWAICRGLGFFGFFAVPEQRVQTRPNRFRVPDVCVVTDKPEGEPGRRIVTRPPYLCVEILSPEDTAIETMAKLREYLDLGVAWVWIIDPVSLAGQVHSRNSVVSREDRIFSTDRFSVDLSKAEL
jgi:Uma2 family endonuclease